MRPFKVIDKWTGEEYQHNSPFTKTLFAIRSDGKLLELSDNFNHHFAPDHLIALQAIGKQDSKGVEIYCGDVVGENDHKFIVHWCNTHSKYVLQLLEDNTITRNIGVTTNITVIGNIYQSQYKAVQNDTTNG